MKQPSKETSLVCLVFKQKNNNQKKKKKYAWLWYVRPPSYWEIQMRKKLWEGKWDIAKEGREKCDKRRREMTQKSRREDQVLILNVPLDFHCTCMYMYMCFGGQRSTSSIFIRHSPPYVLRPEGLSRIFCLDWLPSSSSDAPVSASATPGVLTHL